MEERENDAIDYKAVVEQLQAENEQLRERIASNTTFSPISDAIDSMIIVVKHQDPMKLYIWACMICVIVTAIAQLVEVFLK